MRYVVATHTRSVLTMAASAPNLTLLARNVTAPVHMSGGTKTRDRMCSLSWQGEDYFDDMEAKEECQEATGNAGAQMDRCVLLLFKQTPL